MGAGLIVTILNQQSKPWAENPREGQVRLTGDQVGRILGSGGVALAAAAPDFGDMGGQFRKESLREKLPRLDEQTDLTYSGFTEDDRKAVLELRRMCDTNRGNGAFSVRPLRLP